MFLDSLIYAYEHPELWDPRSIHYDKAILVGVQDWLDVFSDPNKHNLWAGYVSLPGMPYHIQGLLSKDKKHFFYEATSRYHKPVPNSPYTFIKIMEVSKNYVLGYSPEYIYVRDIVADNDKNSFASTHIIKGYLWLRDTEGFEDITNYKEYLTRYVGLNGVDLCIRKNVGVIIEQMLSIELTTQAEVDNMRYIYYNDSIDAIKSARGKIFTTPSQIYLPTEDTVSFIQSGLYTTGTRRGTLII